MATKRIPVKKLMEDMDRFIEYTLAAKRQKPDRIQLTITQFDAIRDHLGKAEYRGIPLEALQ